MVKEKQDKRFLQIFNRNEKADTVEFTYLATLLTAKSTASVLHDLCWKFLE